MRCKICGNGQDNQTYQAREMMFGYRDSFAYLECSRCGCLQIVQSPADVAKYYPHTYHTLSAAHTGPVSLLKRARKRLKCHALWTGGLLGRAIFGRSYPEDELLYQLRSLGKAHLSRNSRILDVGSGRGAVLLELKNAGFERLLGVDPFIQSDIQYPNGLRIRRCLIYDVGGQWDLVMFHHSFEHLPDPLETLRRCSELLPYSGWCLIRLPTVSSYAWKKYRENWVQLDAPRHLFLHSVGSMKVLASKTGFRLEEIVYDSTSFQFWGSEQYVRDIPLMAEGSYCKNPAKSIFSPEEIQSFRKEAEALNARNEGDQAIFYLTKSNEPS